MIDGAGVIQDYLASKCCYYSARRCVTTPDFVVTLRVSNNCACHWCWCQIESFRLNYSNQPFRMLIKWNEKRVGESLTFWLFIRRILKDFSTIKSFTSDSSSQISVMFAYQLVVSTQERMTTFWTQAAKRRRTKNCRCYIIFFQVSNGVYSFCSSQPWNFLGKWQRNVASRERKKVFISVDLFFSLRCLRKKLLQAINDRYLKLDLIFTMTKLQKKAKLFRWST